MSIFDKIGSLFTSVEQFVANLFTSVKKEYLNLAPEAQATFTGIITAGNVLKNYITNPSAYGTVGILISMVEAAIGTTLTSLISSVISEALIDLGIINTAITDPTAAWQQLVAHLQQYSGTALGKEILKVMGTIAEKITSLDTNEVVMILAFLYKTFFTSAPSTTVAAPPVVSNPAPTAAVPLAKAPAQSASDVSTTNETVVTSGN